MMSRKMGLRVGVVALGLFLGAVGFAEGGPGGPPPGGPGGHHPPSPEQIQAFKTCLTQAKLPEPPAPPGDPSGREAFHKKMTEYMQGLKPEQKEAFHECQKKNFGPPPGHPGGQPGK